MAIHLKLVVLAVCAVFLAAPCSAESKKEQLEPSASPSSPPRVVKQINQVNEDNSYTVGYESEDGSFKIETRDSTGHIKEAPSSSATGSTKKPPTVRRQLRFRRPQETESPEDPTPVLSMLLRRSRQGVPTRSDADELLRIQQQQFYNSDSGDVYGSGHQAPESQLRQHLLRGRVQNAVLRQLSPGQLQELQQYVTPEARRALNPAVRALMSPVLDYLSTREQQDFTPYDPYYFYQQQQAYPHPFYFRNNPYQQQPQSQQNYGIYDELRHTLIQRMLLAARLLGVEGMLSNRYTYDADQYGDRLLGQRFYTQPDPRLAYNLRTLPYQHAAQVAREMHERQLAAYQASIAAQGGANHASRAYPRGDDQQGSFVINPVTYAPEVPEFEYSTVTPASIVRSTTASQRPSNIQRVRNVQVITAATASPSSTTAASPTTPRRY